MAFFKNIGGGEKIPAKAVLTPKAKLRIKNEVGIKTDTIVQSVPIESVAEPTIDMTPGTETLEETEYTFTHAKLREEMQRDGSSPMKFINEYYDTDITDIDQSERVREINGEMIGKLVKQYNTLEDAEYGASQDTTVALHKEKLPLLQKINNLTTHNLLLDLNTVGSKDPIAHKIEVSLNTLFTSEKEELEYAFMQATDPRVKAYITTRTLEIDKMENEFKIRLLEKRIWELHVESSPEKDALQNEVSHIKETVIKPILQNLTNSLRSEKELISPDTADEAEKERLNYITGRLIEYSRVV